MEVENGPFLLTTVQSRITLELDVERWIFRFYVQVVGRVTLGNVADMLSLFVAWQRVSRCVWEFGWDSVTLGNLGG